MKQGVSGCIEFLKCHANIDVAFSYGLIFKEKQRLRMFGIHEHLTREEITATQEELRNIVGDVAKLVTRKEASKSEIEMDDNAE